MVESECFAKFPNTGRSGDRGNHHRRDAFEAVDKIEIAGHELWAWTGWGELLFVHQSRVELMTHRTVSGDFNQQSVYKEP